MNIYTKQEYYEKLFAILRTLDSFDVPESDRLALVWAAMDYLKLLGGVIGTESRK